jgi:hypothetical protein
MFRAVLKIASGAPYMDTMQLPGQTNRGRLIGLLSVCQETCAQLRKLAPGLQPAEAFGRLEHHGYGTTRRHRGITPNLDATADAAGEDAAISRDSLSPASRCFRVVERV